MWHCHFILHFEMFGPLLDCVIDQCYSANNSKVVAELPFISMKILEPLAEKGEWLGTFLLSNLNGPLITCSSGTPSVLGKPQMSRLLSGNGAEKNDSVSFSFLFKM